MEQIFESPKVVQENMLKLFGMHRAQKITYEYFNDSYFRPTPSNDKEDIIKNLKHLLAGRMYTFQYDPLYKDTLSFYDERPIMLCIKSYIHPNTKNRLQMGINLNFIPMEIRMFLLETLWKAYKPIIEVDIRRRTYDGKIQPVGRQTKLFTDTYDFMAILDYLWQTMAKSGWRFALRQYIWDRIYNGKFIDYDDWGYTTLIDTKDTVGESIEQIHKIYWKKKNANEIKKRTAKKRTAKKKPRKK